MSTRFRPATPDDAPAIAAVMAAVWPDERPDPARIAAAITRPDHAAFVAGDRGRVSAFVDGFLTHAPNGTRRWEVDLLATLPEARGRGLASALIGHSTAAGRERGAALCRGLVRLGNTAGERTFGRHGYRPDTSELALYTREGSSVTLPGMVAVPVWTFGYDGVWLERAAGAPAETSPAGTGVTGVLLPADDAAARQQAEGAGFAAAGRFRWWHRPAGES